MSSINRAPRGELITVNVSTANLQQEINTTKFFSIKTKGRPRNNRNNRERPRENERGEC